MAIGYRSTGTGSTGAAATSITTTKPSGTVDGDFLVYTLALNAGTVVAEPTVPTGWTRAAPFQVVGAGPSQGQITWYKWAQSEPANYTISGLASGRYSAHIHAFTGVDQITVQDVTATQGSSTSGETTPNPAITPVTPGAWILAEESDSAASGVTNTTYSSSNATQIGTISSTSASTINAALGACYLDTWTSGSFTPNLVPTGTIARSVATTFALRPAAPGVALQQLVFAPGRAPRLVRYRQPQGTAIQQSALTGDASATVTVGLTATGTVGTVGDATSTITVNRTATGTAGAVGDASSTITVGLTAAGTVGAVGNASSTVTVGLASDGLGSPQSYTVPPKFFAPVKAPSRFRFLQPQGVFVPTNPSGDASSTITVNRTATGTVGAVGDASRPETVNLTATGLVGVSSGSALTVVVTFTSAGVVGTITGASRPVTVTLTASGTVSSGGVTPVNAMAYVDGNPWRANVEPGFQAAVDPNPFTSYVDASTYTVTVDPNPWRADGNA